MRGGKVGNFFSFYEKVLFLIYVFSISFSSFPCCEFSQTVILICVPLSDEEIGGFLSIRTELFDGILEG